MDKPPSDPQFFQTFSYYWYALQAEGQGMVMAFVISVLKIVYDGKKFNRRRDVAECVGAPLAAYAAFKFLFAFGVDKEMAIPIGYAIASVGTIWIRNSITAYLVKKFPGRF